MTRRRIPTRERVAIFEREGGRCHLCQMRVEAGQEWDVSHEIPLEMGGEDGGLNLRIAHRRCHRVHTAKVDAPRIAKTRGQRAAHLGAKRSRNPLPFGRDSKLRKKLNGKVVPR